MSYYSNNLWATKGKEDKENMNSPLKAGFSAFGKPFGSSANNFRMNTKEGNFTDAHQIIEPS